MIQKRQLKIQEFKESLKISRNAADRKKGEGVQVFTALKESVERGLNEFMKEMEDKQKTTEKQVEDFIKDLEHAISELKKRSSELKQLSCSKDHLHLLQKFSSLKDAPPTKNWTEVRVRSPSYEGSVVRAMDQLEETLREKMKKLFKAELRRVQQYEVDVAHDRDTAHPEMVLSEDGKQVYDGDVEEKLPDKQKRFNEYAIVFGNQSFSSGRFYFEVQVKGTPYWILGVARESVRWKAEITVSPQNGFWAVLHRNRNKYEALAGPPVVLSLRSAPEKVGVFVDCEESLVSFYDVDAASLMYSFTGCCFTEKLYPYFSPHLKGGKISCPVN